MATALRLREKVAVCRNSGDEMRDHFGIGRRVELVAQRAQLSRCSRVSLCRFTTARLVAQTCGCRLAVTPPWWPRGGDAHVPGGLCGAAFSYRRPRPTRRTPDRAIQNRDTASRSAYSSRVRPSLMTADVAAGDGSDDSHMGSRAFLRPCLKTKPFPRREGLNSRRQSWPTSPTAGRVGTPPGQLWTHEGTRARNDTSLA